MGGESGEHALEALPPAVRIVDQVQEALSQRILNGDLGSGSALSVPDIARKLNVSRSPVREAVLALVAKGLAVEHPRRGVVVTTIEPEDLVAIHEVREFLESCAARYCATRIDDGGIASLRAIMEAQRAAVDQHSARGYFSSNALLHRTIAEHSGNSRLIAIMQPLENQMRIALHRVSTDVSHMQRGYSEHRQIVDAIAARDPDAAENAMRHHIAGTIERVRKLGTRDSGPGPG
jgi:DNA-binding GntR family transcriptional regulator